jgi:hypothetical protein
MGRREIPNEDYAEAVEVKGQVKEAGKLHTGQNTQLNVVISWGAFTLRLFRIPVTLLLDDGCSMACMSFPLSDQYFAIIRKAARASLLLGVQVV